MAKGARVGYGYDVHPLGPGRKLILGGIEIPHSKGLLGHSDSDVLVHAVCDALLGAMGEGDLACWSEPLPRSVGAAARHRIAHVMQILQAEGFCADAGPQDSADAAHGQGAGAVRIRETASATTTPSWGWPWPATTLHRPARANLGAAKHGERTA